MIKTKTWITCILAFVLALSVIGMIAVLGTKDASAEAGDDVYLIPMDGYADTGREAADGGLSLWFVTNKGRGGETVWQGLGQYSLSNEWVAIGGSDEEKLAALTDVCDHLLINGKTMIELMTTEENPNPVISINKSGTAVTRVVLGFYGEGLICLRFHLDAGEILSRDDIETITIKKGFQWYNNACQKLGTGTDQDYTMFYDKANNQFVRQLKQDNGAVAADAVKMTSGPAKTSYFKGDSFDKTGLSFQVTYEDKDENGKNKTGTVPAEKVIVGSYDLNGTEAGTVQIPVFVNGYSVNVAVDYSPLQVDLTKVDQITVDGIAADGYEMETSVTNLTLKNVPYTDGSSADVAISADQINAPVVYEGKCVGKISYLNLEGFEFEYTVKNKTDIPISLEIDASNYSIFHASINNRLGIKVSIPGSAVSRKAIENIDKASWLDAEGNTVQIGDFIYINGVSYTQLFSEYKIRKMLAYGDTLLFDVYTNASEVTEDKVPAEFVDEETGMPKGYLTYDDIMTLEFKPGFAYVTAAKDSWGLGTSMVDSKSYFPVPGAYLKNSVLLVRYPATSSLTRWMRPLATKEEDGTKTTIEQMVAAVLKLAENADDYTRANLDKLFGNVTEDAAVITKPGKTEYVVGDDYSAEGLEVTAKYLDGGTEVLTFNDAAIQGFDSETAGEVDCFVTVNNVRVSFKVTIQEKTNTNPGGNDNHEPAEKKGCGSNVAAVSVALATVALGAAVIVLAKKKNA